MSQPKKRRFYLLAFLAFLFTFPASAEVPVRVVVFGDSLVSGVQLQPAQAYAAQLSHKMREVGFTNVEVLSVVKDGMTTAIGLERISQVLEKRPDIVVLAFGTDDVERGVAVEQMYNNLIAIVDRLRAANAYVVLAGMKAPQSLGYGYVKQFENMYSLIATARKTLLVPNILADVMDNPQMTLADGLHPNSRGMEMMVENSYRYVDTCVRTKIQAAQTQQDYKAYQQERR